LTPRNASSRNGDDTRPRVKEFIISLDDLIFEISLIMLEDILYALNFLIPAIIAVLLLFTELLRKEPKQQKGKPRQKRRIIKSLTKLGWLVILLIVAIPIINWSQYKINTAKQIEIQTKAESFRDSVNTKILRAEIGHGTAIFWLGKFRYKDNYSGYFTSSTKHTIRSIDFNIIDMKQRLRCKTQLSKDNILFVDAPCFAKSIITHGSLNSVSNSRTIITPDKLKFNGDTILLQIEVVSLSSATQQQSIFIPSKIPIETSCRGAYRLYELNEDKKTWKMISQFYQGVDSTSINFDKFFTLPTPDKMFYVAF